MLVLGPLHFCPKKKKTSERNSSWLRIQTQSQRKAETRAIPRVSGNQISDFVKTVSLRLKNQPSFLNMKGFCSGTVSCSHWCCIFVPPPQTHLSFSHVIPLWKGIVVLQKTLSMSVTSPVLCALLLAVWTQWYDDRRKKNIWKLRAISLAGKSALAMFPKDISHD